MNPFMYQDFCSGSYFCPPIETINKLEKIINNGSNIFIASGVRCGKTSLVHYYLENKIYKNQYLTFYFDFFNTNNHIDFIKIFYKKIAQYLPYEYNMTLKILKELFSIVHFTAVINQNGMLEFIPNLNSYNFNELMSDIYKGLVKLSLQNSCRVVLVFDEFQQILMMEDSSIIKKALKKYMEQYPEMRYIFVGSKTYLLEEAFLNTTSLLYNQAQKLEMNLLGADEIFAFVNDKFNNNLSRELFNKMYIKTKGNMSLIQEICYHLYYDILEKKDLKISENNLESTCNNLLSSKSEYYKLILNRFSNPHKIAIKAVIISGGHELYTKNNLFKLQVTKSSLNTAMRYLYKDGFIDKDKNNHYFFTDSCFELWYKNILL